MAAETLTANGLGLLPSRVHRTTDLSTLLAGPGRRTENVEVPGRHGQLRTPRKRYDRTELVLPFWVVGINPDGTIPGPGAGAEAFYARVAEIVAAFGADVVELVHGLPDGSARRLEVEQLAALDPSRKLPGEAGTLSFKVVAWDPFWTDVGPELTATGTSTGASTAWPLTAFSGATAPMDDLVLTLTATAGTVPNPRVEHDGLSVSYLDTLTEGQAVTIDCGTWEVTGSGGLVRDYARVRKTGGEARYLAITPPADVTAAPVASLSHTGTGTLTATLTGRRRHKVG